MDTNNETNTIEIKQKWLFEQFHSAERKGKKLSEKEYYVSINNQLPQNCQILPGNTQLNNQIRTYKRKKQSTRSNFEEIIKSASNEVVLSINLPEESEEMVSVPDVDVIEPDDADIDVVEPDADVAVEADVEEHVVEPDANVDFDVVEPDERPQIAAATEIPPVHLDEQPPQKKSRNSFTATFSKSWKDFNDLQDRQKKNITKPLIEMMETFISTNILP